MKNVMKRLSLVIICVMMIITVSVVPSFAADDQNYENAIIGRAEVSDVPKARANLLPNRLLIDFDATATSVILKFKNIGVDSIDTITATVTVGDTKKSVTVLKANPGTTQKTVNINMKNAMRIFLYIQLQRMVGTASAAARRKAPGIYRQTF